jgi:hypothetical protein
VGKHAEEVMCQQLEAAAHAGNLRLFRGPHLKMAPFDPPVIPCRNDLHITATALRNWGASTSCS